MDLALNNLQRLIKPKQPTNQSNGISKFTFDLNTCENYKFEDNSKTIIEYTNVPPTKTNKQKKKKAVRSKKSRKIKHGRKEYIQVSYSIHSSTNLLRDPFLSIYIRFINN